MTKNLPQPLPIREGRVFQTGTRAFTLLEVVLAVALFGLLMAGVASIWVVCWKATEQIARGGHAESQEALVLKRLGEAIQASIYHSRPSAFYLWKGTDDREGAEESDNISFVTALAPDVAESSVEFAPPERIMLSVQQDDQGRRQLVMQAGPFTMETDDWQRTTVLVEDIGAFHVRFWSDANKEWVDGWTDEGHAPAAVQLAISRKGETIRSDLQFWEGSSTVRVLPSIELDTSAPNAPPAANPNP